MIKNIIFLLFIIPSLTLYSKTIYVSKQGDDSNNGEINSPLLTIQKALDMLVAGDTCFIRAGVYYESLRLTNSGTETKPIRIYNFNNEKVEIHNTTVIQNWTTDVNNIYKTKIKDSVTQLFINNRPYMQASFPSVNEGEMSTNSWGNATAYSNKKITITGLSQFNNLNGAKVFGLHGDRIVGLNGTVIAQSGETVTLQNDAWYWNEAFSTSYLGSGKAFVIGNKQFLDTPGEWYQDSTFLYFIPLSQSNNTEDKIEIRHNIVGLNLEATKHIIISGITFFGGSINMKNSENITITNCEILYVTPLFNFRQGFEKFGLKINKYDDPQSWNGSTPNLDLYDGPDTWSGKGIEISGQNNTLEKCIIKHSWGDGVTMWGTNNTVNNCIIQDCDWLGIDCAPLCVSGKNHIISNNEISHSGRSVLLHRFLSNSKITNNNIHHGALLCDDAGLTYCFWTEGNTTEIAYNWLHDLQCKKNGAGIYIDNWSYNMNIHHNVISNCLVGININKPNKNIAVWNNTLFKNQFSMGSWGAEGTESSNFKTFNNITDTDKKLSWNYDSFYGTQLDSNYLYSNNIFVDPSNNNFELKPNSMAINSGIKNEYTIDYFGTLPDKGAFEYGKTPLKTGSSLILQNKKNENPYPTSNLSLVKNTKDSTLLQWEYVHGFIDSYYVQRKKSGETEYKTVKIVDSTFFQFNDTISELGEFRYQILAKNKYGFASPSNSVEVFKNQNITNGIFLDAENNDLQNGTTITEETIGYLDNKDWVAFKQVDFGKELVDACNIRYAVPCSNAWQNIQIRLDSYMGEIVGEHITENTGGWDKFEIKTFPIKPTTGIHDIYIKFRGKFGIGTLDWFQLYNSNGTVKKTLQKDPKCPQPYTTSSEIPVKLFPNPGNDLLRVSFENTELASATVEIYNTIGHKISTQSFTELYPGEIELYVDSKALDLGLKSAFYIIKVNIESESHNQETILKYIRL